MYTLILSNLKPFKHSTKQQVPYSKWSWISALQSSALQLHVGLKNVACLYKNLSLLLILLITFWAIVSSFIIKKTTKAFNIIILINKVVLKRNIQFCEGFTPSKKNWFCFILNWQNSKMNWQFVINKPFT